MTGFRRPPRAHPADTKMEAACSALLAQLEQIDPATEVVLVAFAGRAREVCRGRAGDARRFERAAAALQPHNGTEVHAALELAARILHAGASRLPQVVLISDGLSSLEPAVAAAGECLALGARVDIHVIDPVEEAKRFAIAVTAAVGGRWETVTSRGALAQAGLETAERATGVRAAVESLEHRRGAELRELGAFIT